MGQVYFAYIPKFIYSLTMSLIRHRGSIYYICWWKIQLRAPLPPPPPPPPTELTRSVYSPWELHNLQYIPQHCDKTKGNSDAQGDPQYSRHAVLRNPTPSMTTLPSLTMLAPSSRVWVRFHLAVPSSPLTLLPNSSPPPLRMRRPHSACASVEAPPASDAAGTRGVGARGLTGVCFRRREQLAAVWELLIVVCESREL